VVFNSVFVNYRFFRRKTSFQYKCQTWERRQLKKWSNGGWWWWYTCVRADSKCAGSSEGAVSNEGSGISKGSDGTKTSSQLWWYWGHPKAAVELQICLFWASTAAWDKGCFAKRFHSILQQQD
jgi:hypothetical protein